MTRAAAVLALGLLAACGGHDWDDTSIVAAGDIASCFWRGDEATARLLDEIPGVVVTLGDNVYPSGTDREFRQCYARSWGRHLDRTRPSVGNHEYKTKDAAGYFNYFGERAGPRGKGWYSFDHEGWHLIALNSDEPLKRGSEQYAWLVDDLRRHRDTRCTLAFYHHPRWSSGKHGGADRVMDAYRALYDGGVDVVLSGHDHHYERFAPLDPVGRVDEERGIRSFVVGTGGAPSYDMPGERRPHSEAIADEVRGVLRMKFHRDSYEWEFVPIPGRRFEDSGRGECH
ncbi:metallophosphoesterase family protein [Longimicrobium sp.]|uniref:metallophosphoesterase family protein n=1 Tax=Longimicrobium sp. TaxID=2029185 RepID=UPI002E32EC7A|nr:metallophosphoesterase [Longimicrobium sp.]HEX6040260.1 metallophosphoesterase [Longimicrobium sp.]